MTERQLSNCTHVPLTTNCRNCGIYIHPNNPATKTSLYDSVTHISAPKYLKHLRQRKSKVLPERELSQTTSLLLESICDKFQYTIQTLALGVYVFMKACHKQFKDQKFWASSALLVASKAIQLDKRVPYLNRYQRYADKNFTPEDYEFSEKVIFQEMEFTLLHSTFMSFLHFYLSNGIVFKSDNCQYASIKSLQDQVLRKAKNLIRKGTFITSDPQYLALTIIKESRMKFKIQGFPSQLQGLSGRKSNEIKIEQKIQFFQPLCIIDEKLKQRANVIDNIDSKVKYGRKRLQNTMKQSVKQNTMEMLQPKINVNNIHRNQTFSMSKYQNSYSTCSRSTDRIVPLHSFVSRRA